MSDTISRFRPAYREAVADVMPFLGPDRLAGLAAHNPAWGRGRFDVEAYLQASETRYVTALEVFERSGGNLDDGLRVLDIGGFMGALPLALRRLGAEVTLSERYDYYDGAFDDLRDHLVAAGIEVWDLDLTAPVELPDPGSFGLVTNMALLEHLAHTPRPVMENMAQALHPQGRAIVEVPNLAYWPKRLAALAGRTVHPPLRDVYQAREPFTGHHREYTEHDLRELLEISGFVLDELVTFNYSRQDPGPTGPARLLDWPRREIAGAREVLLACARPPGAARPLAHPRENAYGSRKRLDWIRSRLQPGDHVLEVGCGTGAMITLPLLDQGVDVRGTDLDAGGIAIGREIASGAGLDSGRLETRDLREMGDERFDAVICSEVLEHQDDAGVADLLGLIRERVRPGGLLFVTVPNGYGWFELESAVWYRVGLGRVVEALRLDVLLRLIKQRAVGDYVDAAHPSAVDTSPHLQRFTLRSIRRTLRDAGFEVVTATGSALFAGPFSHMLLTGRERAMARNTRWGDRLPGLASGFFVLARRPLDEG